MGVELDILPGTGKSKAIVTVFSVKSCNLELMTRIRVAGPPAFLGG